MIKSVPLKWLFSIILFLLVVALSLDSRTESQALPVWCSMPLSILLGLYLLLNGVLKRRRRLLVGKYGIRTIGSVIDIHNSKHHTLLSIQYNLPDCQVRIAKSKQNVIFDFGLTGIGMIKEREIDIIYNPVVPSEVYFPESFTFRWYPIIEMIVGIIIVIGTVLTFLI